DYYCAIWHSAAYIF
nr:immunoglobulin light chain junction region [Macaca mulatta]